MVANMEMFIIAMLCLIATFVVMLRMFETSSQAKQTSLSAPIHFTTSRKYSVLVSYAIYAPPGSSRGDHLQCMSNTEYFVKAISPSLTKDEGVLYYFTLIGNTSAPKILVDHWNKYTNVILSSSAKVPVDLMGCMSV